VRDLERAIKLLRVKRDVINKRLALLEEVERQLAAVFGDEAPPKARKKPGPKPKAKPGPFLLPKSKPQTSAGGVKLCKRGHERTPENTYPSNGGCKKCMQLARDRYNAKQARTKREAAAPAEDEPAPVESAPVAPAAVVSTPPAKVVAMSEPKPSAPAGPKWPKREDYKPPPRDNRFYAGRGWR
jgi:hypothetical protein